MVLFDKVVRGLLPDTTKENVIVAHFDHGIRRESARDAEFVRELAEKYNLPFKLGKASLGKDASESSARKARYEFLRSINTELDSAQIVTAHHQDDLIETVVMNILRGTEWRGLAPFWSDDITRPLIDMNKAEIIEYAIRNNLEWVEDETNYDSKYFRNRVRLMLDKITPEQREKIVDLNHQQSSLRLEIEQLLSGISELSESSLINLESVNKIDEKVRLEVLNKITRNKLTTPQLRRLGKFLKVAKIGDICQPGGGVQIVLNRDKMISLTTFKK